MRFVWCLYPATPTEKPGFFKVPHVITEGATTGEAYEKLLPLIPEGSRMWCWWPENAPVAQQVEAADSKSEG